MTRREEKPPVLSMCFRIGVRNGRSYKAHRDDDRQGPARAAEAGNPLGHRGHRLRPGRLEGTLAGKVARGDDPAAEKQEERRRANASLRQLLAEGGEYERHLRRRHIVNTKAVMSGLRRGLGRLMGKNVAQITRQAFVTAITAIEDQGKPGAADDLRERKFTRTFCDWAPRRGKPAR
jgi:hypothetical protein